MADVLILDDDPDVCAGVADSLRDFGHSPRCATCVAEALSLLGEERPDLVLLDVWLERDGVSGLDLIEEIDNLAPGAPVIVISGRASIELAVSSVRRGAYDFLEKPFSEEKLALTIDRALESRRLAWENRELKRRDPLSTELVGGSSAIGQVRNTIARVAPTNRRVLISGPPGSGKAVAARAIHAKSERAAGPFVAINAADARTTSIAEALFGVEAQDAAERRVGAFEQAHRGTLYIQNVGSMPSDVQALLVRALVERSYRRCGGTRAVPVDVRVLASTSADLDQLTGEQRFRSDLLHRLSVESIRMPALAARREDVPTLIEHFCLNLARNGGARPARLGDDAVAALQACDWPGNVRQLRNVLERVFLLADDVDSAISAEMLPVDVTAAAQEALPSVASDASLIALPLRDARERFERQYLQAQITRFSGNISRTAAFIGMERSALHRKIKSLGLNLSRRGGVVPAE